VEDRLISAVLVFAILIGILHLVSKWTPSFVKRRLWRPAMDFLWHTPRRRKGVLWTIWFIYCVGVSMATVSLFFADGVSGRDVFGVFLLSIPAALGKKLLDYRSKRKQRRYQLPARRRNAPHRASRRRRLPGRP